MVSPLLFTELLFPRYCKCFLGSCVGSSELDQVNHRIPAATSSLFAGHLADSVGRVRGVAIGELIFGIGAAIEAGSVKSLGMLIVGRCVAGIGEGLFLSTLYT